MSVVTEAIPTLKHVNVKDEEQNIGKLENLCSQLRENIDIDDNLSKDITKKTDHNVIKEIDNNACLTSTAELSVEPKFATNKELQKHAKTEESLRNEKQLLPITIEASAAQEKKEAQVEILSLSIISPGRDDVVLPIPFSATTSKTTLFTLKEGSKYHIKFHLTVSRNTVKNLRYTYMVWKSGLRVHQTKKIVGTLSPREEPYIYESEEGTTPSGFFARGPFLVRSKFVDDDDNCYLDTTYYFDIRKDWGARDKC